MTAEANWYPDPEDPSRERWWDGTSWTEQRRPAPPSGSEPPPPPPPPGDDQPSWASSGAYAGSSSAAPSGAPGGADFGARAADRPQLADLGKRLGATLLDFLVAAVALYGPVIVAAIVGAVFRAFGQLGDVIAALLLIAGFIAGLGLTILLSFVAEGRTGQTYGKHVLDVAVIGVRDGRPIGSGAAFGRAIVKSLGLYALGLGWLWATWDDDRQGWHDKAVSSLVVDAAQPTLNPVAFVQHVWRSRP